jgi:hypothetical protein
MFYRRFFHCQQLLLYHIIISCISLGVCAADKLEDISASSNNLDAKFVGWTPPPTGRGTLDIIISCCFTIFLCCWYSVCINVAAEGDGWWEMFRDKLSICLLGILGPEFTLILSMGQYDSASESVKQFAGSGYPQWTITHAFFADMGGFVLRSPDFVTFPLDAKQLHYLVVKGHVKFPEAGKREIDDKNKINLIARLVALGQVSWFTINSLARLIQRKGLTIGELTTLSFIFCTMATSYYWRHKPSDVECAIELKTPSKIADILRDAGDAAQLPYRNTPLDFVSRQEWTVSRHWVYWRFLLRKLHIEPLIFRFPKGRPLKRIQDDTFFLPPPRNCYIYMLLTSIHCAIFLAGWNFEFPTPIERTLWRIVPVLQLASSLSAMFYIALIELARPRLQERSENHDAEKACLPFGMFETFRGHTQRLPRLGEKHDPSLQIGIMKFIFFSTLAGTYAICRIFILLEDWISIRSVPPSIYESVEWSRFLPHL